MVANPENKPLGLRAQLRQSEQLVANLFEQNRMLICMIEGLQEKFHLTPEDVRAIGLDWINRNASKVIDQQANGSAPDLGL